MNPVSVIVAKDAVVLQPQRTASGCLEALRTIRKLIDARLPDARLVTKEGEALKNHSFTTVASGRKRLGDTFADRFYGAGCDDATACQSKKIISCLRSTASRGRLGMKTLYPYNLMLIPVCTEADSCIWTHPEPPS